MGALLRSVANLVAVVLALGLLGILLLTSSGGDDARQRQLDHNLRELREIATTMQSEVVTADGLELDVSERFESLERAFGSIRERLDQLAQTAQEREASVLTQGRQAAFELFNTIDPSTRERMSASELAERLKVLSSEADVLQENVSTFAGDQKLYLQQRDALSERGRDLVRRLRQSGFEEPADTAFAGMQQAIQRIRRSVADETAPAEATLQRLREIEVTNSTLKTELESLANDGSNLLTRRLMVIDGIEKITSSALPELAGSLRESVGGDYLYTLRTVGESRMLLNVYTAMMLIIMVYLGVRLARNHQVLNLSHALLEERVKERTKELESAYDDLKESQVQLVQAEKMSSLGQLVAGVVHEINTPLLYVMNNTEMTHETVSDLERDLQPVRELVRALNQPKFPKEQVRALLNDVRTQLDVETLDESLNEVTSLTADSKEGLEDIDALVKSLKDFSRLDRAQFDRFDVREGLEKTLLITKNTLKYGIEVERDFQEVPEILCAPSRVNQIFINLITNAAQAMDGEGKLTICTFGDDEWVHVEVSDTGCGIPRENLDKVLDPFFTTKPVGQGTGLGLSIVRTIMDEHQGKLAIDSEVGVGTKITLSFPVNGARDGSESNEEAEAA